MNYLYPLSKKKFMQLHREAWENGWTYGPGFKELYDDYLINWVYFVDYLDLLIRTNIDNSRNRQYERSNSDVVTLCFEDGKVIQKKLPDFHAELFNSTSTGFTNNYVLNILIGEAPPFWAGNSQNKNRSYYYHPGQTLGSTWLNAPYKYFHYLNYPQGVTGNKINFEVSKKSLTFIDPKPTKPEKLEFLAKQGVILLDIFPFPVRQATKIRETVTADFSEHLKNHFRYLYQNVKNYIHGPEKPEIDFRYALAAPILTAIQILYGSKSKEAFKTIVEKDLPLTIKDFSTSSTPPASLKDFDIQTYYKKRFNKKNSFRTFFGKIAFDNGTWKINELNPFEVNCDHSKTAILMDSSGNVNFSNFFNAADKNLTKKINSKEKDNEEEV